jgi:hypothetical protein
VSDRAETFRKSNNPSTAVILIVNNAIGADSGTGVTPSAPLLAALPTVNPLFTPKRSIRRLMGELISIGARFAFFVNGAPNPISTAACSDPGKLILLTLPLAIPEMLLGK